MDSVISARGFYGLVVTWYRAKIIIQLRAGLRLGNSRARDTPQVVPSILEYK